VLGYERLGKGEKEARIGLDSEEDIVNRINIDERFNDRMRNCLVMLGFGVQGRLRAFRNDVKSDVFIQINEREVIGV